MNKKRGGERSKSVKSCDPKREYKLNRTLGFILKIKKDGCGMN